VVSFKTIAIFAIGILGFFMINVSDLNDSIDWDSKLRELIKPESKKRLLRLMAETERVLAESLTTKAQIDDALLEPCVGARLDLPRMEVQPIAVPCDTATTDIRCLCCNRLSQAVKIFRENGKTTIYLAPSCVCQLEVAS
jgi:hypothetical protein